MKRKSRVTELRGDNNQKRVELRKNTDEKFPSILVVTGGWNCDGNGSVFLNYEDSVHNGCSF